MEALSEKIPVHKKCFEQKTKTRMCGKSFQPNWIVLEANSQYQKMVLLLLTKQSEKKKHVTNNRKD